MKFLRTFENRGFSVSRKLYKFSRKSQAAMEFLMTYGWAILVVLVAIGALAYFGVLSPDQFLPAKCQLPSGLACTDFVINDAAETITLVIRNGIGFDISDLELAIDGPGTACDTAVVDAGSGLNDDCGIVANCVTGLCPLANGDMCTFRVTCDALTPVPSGKFRGDITITYVNQDTGLTHNVEGTIIGRAE